MSFCKQILRPSELIFNNFKKGKRIGFGSSGDVFDIFPMRESATQNEQKMVLKVVRCKDEQIRAQIREKYNQLMQLQTDKIVPFLACFDVEIDIGVLMPKYQGTLYDLIQQGRKFQEQEIHRVAVFVLDGIMCLHQNQIIHRDIKPSNIFLAPTHEGEQFYYYIIGDMEVAKFLSKDMSYTSGGGGTFAHFAPEQIQSQATFTTDI